jgi:peptide-methionine (S)-S-oxide reductase
MRKQMWLAALALFITTGGTMAAETKKATFAGGCFWCMHAEFAQIEGVSSVLSGYTGGHTPNPTYQQVSAGDTGHFEAIEVVYDPSKVTYQKLLDVFWSNVDPLDEHGQFCDKGSQYRAGIFTHDDEQKRLAEASRQQVAKRFAAPVATVIQPASTFYAAEDYHQEYYIKNQTRYKLYKAGCGRDRRLQQLQEMPKP